MIEGRRCAAWMLARRNLKGFLWSDSACEGGAATLWAAVQSRGASNTY
jgi:hypothetical protein